MKRCRACGGTFEPFGADGFQNYHTCPPLSVDEIAALVQLPALDLVALVPEIVNARIQRPGFRDDTQDIDGAGLDDAPIDVSALATVADVLQLAAKRARLPVGTVVL